MSVSPKTRKRERERNDMVGQVPMVMEDKVEARKGIVSYPLIVTRDTSVQARGRD